MVVYEEAVSDWSKVSTVIVLCDSDCVENSCGCDSEGGGCDTANDNCPNDL